MRLRPIAALVVAATVIGIGAAWWVTSRQPVTLASGTALEAPRRIGAFRLTDHRRKPTAPGVELGGAIRVVFLGVDPARDTAERLAGYVGHFNPRFVAVTGARAEIDALCRDLGIAYVQNPGAGGDYTVDHSAALVLIDPRARVAGYFQPPHDSDALAADLAALADGAG